MKKTQHTKLTQHKINPKFKKKNTAQKINATPKKTQHTK